MTKGLMLNNLEILGTVLGIFLLIVTTAKVIKKDIFDFLLTKMFGRRLNILEIRDDNKNFEIIVQNTKAESIIITQIKLEIEQAMFQNEPAPYKYQLPVSDIFHFVIDPQTKLQSEVCEIIIKPNEGEKIRICITTGSYHTRIAKYRFKLYSGERICGVTDFIIDIFRETNDDSFIKLGNTEVNNNLIKEKIKSKVKKTKRFKKEVKFLRTRGVNI